MRLSVPRHWRRRSSRGQALVEFALVLPLLVLLLVMAIDFGRVFFGWVALHNAVRIGADYAAGHSTYWDGMLATYSDERQRFDDLIVNDLQALNCELQSPDPVPDPVFGGFADGDLVEAEVSCSFGLVTPLAESVLGGPVGMTVRTQFAVNRTLVGALPGDGGGTPPDPPPMCGAPVAAFTTSPAPSGGRVTIDSGDTVTFTDDSDAGEDCGTVTYGWDFANGDTADTDGPHTITFTHLGSGPHTNYTVTLTVTTIYGSDTDSVVVRARP